MYIGQYVPECMAVMMEIGLIYMETKIKKKPIAKIVSNNNYKRFDSLYACYCPSCKKLLKRTETQCTCGQEIDWSEWR